MTCANPRFPRCKHPKAAHIPGGCDQCVIVETCDQYMEGPPCYAQGWAKATGHEVFLYGWDYDLWAYGDAKAYVPAHDSDAWLAGMVRAMVPDWWKTSWGLRALVGQDNTGTKLFIVHPGDNEARAGYASTLHAALCRAVTPNITHTC